MYRKRKPGRSHLAAGHLPGAQAADARSGSTLVVVIALLGALAFLGFVALTLSSQEETNAQYFADTLKGLHNV